MRAELVNRLAAAGLPRIEAVSFVRDDRVPQMAGAEEVVAGIERARGNRVLRPRAQRARLRALRRDRARPGERDPRRDGGVQPPERQRLARRGDRARRSDPGRGPGAGDGHDQCRLRLPVRRAGRPGPGGELAGRFDWAEVVLADTIGVAAPREVRSLLDRTGVAGFHGHNTRNTGYANALAALEVGRDRARRVGRRPRRLPVRAARERQRGDRGSRLPARARGRRDRHRPRRADRISTWLEGIFGRKLEGQLYRAGDFPA